jgi:hypothetical protein
MRICYCFVAFADVKMRSNLAPANSKAAIRHNESVNPEIQSVEPNRNPNCTANSRQPLAGDGYFNASGFVSLKNIHSLI